MTVIIARKFLCQSTFCVCSQNHSENVREFAARLQKSSMKCNFGDRLNDNLKDMFTIGVLNNRITYILKRKIKHFNIQHQTFQHQHQTFQRPKSVGRKFNSQAQEHRIEHKGNSINRSSEVRMLKIIILNVFVVVNWATIKELVTMRSRIVKFARK